MGSLTKLPNTLIKLKIHGLNRRESLSFLTRFTNLQEIVLFDFQVEGFKVLHHTIFPQLKILKFKDKCPDHEDIIKFLEINGKNLEQLHFNDTKDDVSNLDIVKFCPNLKSLI